MTEEKQGFPYVFFAMSALLFLFLLESDAVTRGVRTGLSLCYFSILPSVFPFMIFSSYFSSARSFGKQKRSGLPDRIFSRLMGMESGVLAPFLIGVLCGFPLGARMVSDGYKNGRYTKEESEYLLCFVNNTSLSFLVAGVGGSMRKSVSDGILLFAVQLISALVISLLFRPKLTCAHHTLSAVPYRSFSFPTAVRESVLGALTVCGFITFFSAVVSLLSVLPLPAQIYPYIISMIEVGNATSSLASHPYGLSLSGFAVSFAGLSVHMQTAAMLDGTDLSMKKYLVSKFLQGLFSFVLLSLCIRILPS